MRRLPTLCAVIALAAPAADIAFGHAKVTSRTPAKSATLSKGPTSVSITFTQQLRTGTLTVSRSGRTVMRGGKDPRNVKRLRATRSKRLGSGVYTVRWAATAPDGHKQKGSWTFRVR